LTHSLEVAQIARSVAERFLANHPAEQFDIVGGLDCDVTEAAALAHDLGHPPFGHVSETVLNRLLDSNPDSSEGFEGNAQTFRILTSLATRYEEVEGLNLTRATLSAVSKYPWRRSAGGEKRQKWGAYESEGKILDWSRNHLLSALHESKTIEAEIMDFADDVAYAVHDLEDFYRAGMVPLEKLKQNPLECDLIIDGLLQRKPTIDKELHREVLGGLVQLFPPTTYLNTQKGKATLRSLTSSLVNRYIVAVSFDPQNPGLGVPSRHRAELEVLKSLTWHYVIESRALLTTRHGYSAVIQALFTILSDAASLDKSGNRTNNLGIFPDFYRERLERARADSDAIPRAVADTIASLTEAQAISLHQRLTGQSLGAVLDPIL
jgi:dGTPase